MFSVVQGTKPIEEIKTLPTKEIKNIAATKIQNAYRQHIVRLISKKQKEVAIPLQSTYQIPSTQGQLEQKASLASLLCNMSTNSDSQIEFNNPKSLLSYFSLEICEIEGKLIALDNRYGKYATSDISIDEILRKASARSRGRRSESIAKILSHKNFENSLNPFIEFALGTNELGTPRLFGFSNYAILDILEAGSKIKAIDPLKIIDPISNRNIVLHLVRYWDGELLNKLIEFFPHILETMGQSILAEFLLSGHNLEFFSHFLEKTKLTTDKLATYFALDTYHNLWLEIAQKKKPEETFKQEFMSLSSEQKRTIYDTAYTYNNPFIHEPADHIVEAGHYSINLMWINKSKIPANQEFLFGDGSSAELQRLDFQKKFVSPIAEWAKANPGTPINIWVDREMASAEAIERSRQALEKFLEGTVHGVVHFRDVRSIKTVQDNATVFSEHMPIYFRVDLLRAIVADDVLQKKETKYFVYGDIDMQPLSGKQLFDKKTIGFLDDFGIVMAKGGHLGFENGFQILNGDNPQCMNSHRKVIIDLSIEMALECPNAIKEQQIYDTYPAMILHFLDADGRYGKLYAADPGGIYEVEETEKSNLFRYDKFKYGCTGLVFKQKECKLEKIMPRKPVLLPPSHFSY